MGPARRGRPASRRQRVADVLDRGEGRRAARAVRATPSSPAGWPRCAGTCCGSCIEAAERGKTVVGYGAPGKGNTLLNHCGIRPDLLAYTVDRNPYKHGRFTPGTRIPILPPEQIAADRPDYVLVLPWNLRDRAHRAAVLRRTTGAAGWSSPSRN